AADHAAQKPARAVDADEPGDALARTGLGRNGHLGEQLGPERAVALLDAPALTGHLRADLLARLVPQAGRPRRREGLDLQRRVRVVEPDRDDALRLLLDLET